MSRTASDTTSATGYDAAAGAAAYKKRSLWLYDFVVHGVSNRVAWRCPTRLLREMYERHASGVHMDVGVGSGYFLDHCRFPVKEPRITLVDLSEASLEFTSRRISRYRPATLKANVLEPISVPGKPFQSIAMMYLLHCLPGTLETKARVFSVFGSHLAPGGVLFGATILGAGIERSLPARALMRAYNARGIFGNSEDSQELLEAGLASHFEQYEVQVHGCVALFSARSYRPLAAG